MPTKYINTSLSQLKQYAEALEESIASTQWIIDDFELEEDSHTHKHLAVLKGILGYIQQDIQFIEEYEEQLESYRKQLEAEDDL